VLEEGTTPKDTAHGVMLHTVVATGSTQRVAGNIKQTTGSRQHAIENGQRATGKTNRICSREKENERK
jgi:hypothetical protein